MPYPVRGVVRQWIPVTVTPQAATTAVVAYAALNAYIPAAPTTSYGPAAPIQGAASGGPGYGGYGGGQTYPQGLSGGTVHVESFMLENTTGAAITVTISRVPNGGTSYNITTAQSIAANTTVYFGAAGTNGANGDNGIVYLAAGDTVSITASAAGLNVGANIRVDRPDFTL